MNLPFIVYGAREGYQWLNGDDLPSVFRENLRRLAGKLPDFDIGESGSCGLVNIDQNILVYRFMRQPYTDMRGRKATCLVMTFFPRSMASNINAEDILRSSLFLNPPMTALPDVFEYKGGRPTVSSLPIPQHKVEMGVFSNNGSLDAACNAFAYPFSGRLRIMRTEPTNKGAVYSYNPVLNPASTEQALVGAPESRTHGSESTQSLPIAAMHGCPWPVVGLCASAMFLAGVLAGVFYEPFSNLKNLFARHNEPGLDEQFSGMGNGYEHADPLKTGSELGATNNLDRQSLITTNPPSSPNAETNGSIP